MPWQDVAEVIAPTIATALMGPAGGVVATIAAKFLFENGGDSPALATPKAVAEKIATLGSPEDLAKLKQAEAAVKQFESDNKFRFADLDARSVQDARTMRLSALGQGNSTADRLSWVVIASFGVVSVVTLFGCYAVLGGTLNVTPENAAKWTAVSGLVGAIMGYFSANAQQVVGFYFGSSSGSAAKSDHLAQATADAMAAVGRAGTASPPTTETTVQLPGATVVASTGGPAPARTEAANSDGAPESAADWSACIEHVLACEGGFVDDAADRGGPTNRGITQATLAHWRGRPVTAEDVKELSEEEARNIYRANYWNAAGCDRLPRGVNLCVFDAAVMSGPGRGVRFLQQAANMSGAEIDGIVGPRTLAVVRRAAPDALVAGISAHREAFYRHLADTDASQKRFLDGWVARVRSTQAQAQKMIGADAGTGFRIAAE